MGCEMVKISDVVRALCAAAMLSVLPQAAAYAHDPDAESMFFRDRNASVKGRTRPEYQSEGIQTGAWIWDPELKVGVIAHDNIFATSVNTQSDTILTFNPTLDVETTWSRHGIEAYASAVRFEYADFSSESVWNYEIGAAAHLDIASGTLIEFGGGYASLTEERTRAGAAFAAAEPVEFDTSALFVGIQREFNRVRLLGRIDWGEFDFDDAMAVGGGVIDQDFRDRSQTMYTLRGDYAVSPDTSIFLRLRHNEREYDQQPPAVALNRDSSGFMIDVGADFDIGGVARGIVGVGYNEQDYDSPSIGSIDGFGVDGLVEWFPTELTTVTFSGSRYIEESPIIGSGGYTATDLSITVDHELRRNLILSASVGIAEDDYLDIDRTDDRWQASASATWFINRNLGAEVWVTHVDQDSQGVAGNRDYETNAVGLRLVLRP